MKTFSLEEAQTLVPVLESLMKNAMEARDTAETIAQELQQLSQRIFMNGGTLVRIAEVAKRRAQQDKAVQQVKDLDTGLLDFPCRLGDDIVLLCWKMGETEIQHWHPVEGGFAARQPVDERFRRAQKQKPN